jgi:hypothetical protein
MIRRTENRLTTQTQKPVWWKTITLLIFIEVGGGAGLLLMRGGEEAKDWKSDGRGRVEYGRPF